MPLLNRSVIRRVPHCTTWRGRATGKWGLPGAGFKQGRHYLKRVKLIDGDKKWLVRGWCGDRVWFGPSCSCLLITDFAPTNTSTPPA